jgi:hypothetical protein
MYTEYWIIEEKYNGYFLIKVSPFINANIQSLQYARCNWEHTNQRAPPIVGNRCLGQKKKQKCHAEYVVRTKVFPLSCKNTGYPRVQNLSSHIMHFGHVILAHLIGNVSSENQPLHANYENFNLSHMMLIQRRAHGRWEGSNHPSYLSWVLHITPSTFHKSSLGSISCGSDWSFHNLHRRLVYTWYVPHLILPKIDKISWPHWFIC